MSKQTTQNGENGAEIKISWQNYKIIKAPCKLTSRISITNKKVKTIVLYYTQGDLISLTTSKKKTKNQKKRGRDFDVFMLLNHQTFGTDGAVILSLGFAIERQETEPPLARNIHSLHHASTVGTRSWCWLSRQNPLILVAHKHKTHLLLFWVFFCLLE